MKLNWETTYQGTVIVKECWIPLDENFKIYLFRRSEIYRNHWRGYIEFHSKTTRRFIEDFPPSGFVGGYPEKELIRLMKSSLRKILKNFHKNSFTK